MASDGDKLKNLVSFKTISNNDNSIQNFNLNIQINDLICSLCDDIVQSPVRCKECNTLYCLDCVDSLKKKRKKCVNLNTSTTNITHPINITFPDNNLENILSTQIYFKCKNASQGCNYKTQNISEISFHLIDCNLILKTCPNSGCDFIGSDDDIEQHSYTCKFFAIKCSVCSYKFTSFEEQAKHNCMIKIVEEVTLLEEMISSEKGKLDHYIVTKRNNLIEYAKKHNILITYCVNCKGAIHWLQHIDLIENQGYHMCSSVKNDGVNLKDCNKNFRFQCKSCKICFCTRCVPLKPKEECYCGNKMKIEALVNHFCDVCGNTIEKEAWACAACLFDVCFNCLSNGE